MGRTWVQRMHTVIRPVGAEPEARANYTGVSAARSLSRTGFKKNGSSEEIAGGFGLGQLAK